MASVLQSSAAMIHTRPRFAASHWVPGVGALLAALVLALVGRAGSLLPLALPLAGVGVALVVMGRAPACGRCAHPFADGPSVPFSPNALPTVLEIARSLPSVEDAPDSARREAARRRWDDVEARVARAALPRSDDWVALRVRRCTGCGQHGYLQVARLARGCRTRFPETRGVGVGASAIRWLAQTSALRWHQTQVTRFMRST